MTIAERKARERYDREHPWQPIASLDDSMIGMICELRVSVYSAVADMGRNRYFWTGSKWYLIEPPERGPGSIMEFRSTGIRLDERRQRLVIDNAEHPRFEYVAGELRRRPKRYKLYWRADN